MRRRDGGSSLLRACARSVRTSSVIREVRVLEKMPDNIPWLEAQTGVRYETLRKHYAAWIPSSGLGGWNRLTGSDWVQNAGGAWTQCRKNPGNCRGGVMRGGGFESAKAESPTGRGYGHDDNDQSSPSIAGARARQPRAGRRPSKRGRRHHRPRARRRRPDRQFDRDAVGGDGG